jgi:hypothetical protein
MTDAYIINPSRNSNTFLQTSTLQTNGTLSKNYSFQTIRTVKGRAVLLNTDGNSNINVPLINEYDGSPIQLYPGDIIMSISIYNGNEPFSYPNIYTQTLYKNKYPIPFLNGGYFTLSVTPPPTYNYQSKNWIPDTSTSTDLCSLYLYSLSSFSTNGVTAPLSYNTRPLYNSAVGSITNNSLTSYNGSSRWLTCKFQYMSTPIIQSFTQQTLSSVSINVTLLILNPSSTQ